jgi:hypothetical protein
MILKVDTHNTFSFTVRMNRSAQPLPSGIGQGRRAVDAEEGQFLLEVIGHVPWTVIVAHARPRALSLTISPQWRRLPGWISFSMHQPWATRS